MQTETEIERVTPSNGQVASAPVRMPTDSRLVDDSSSDARQRGDIGSKGQQFILASWATLAAGLWVLISPWVLTFAGYAPDARANSLTLGALIATMGATRVFGNYRSGRLNQIISALTVLPGIYLIAAPFLWGFTDRTRPTYDLIISGIAVVLFALWSYTTSKHDADDRGR
jgi:FtsH-binding integral membrane protein